MVNATVLALFQTMIDNENAVGDLYELFARQFPLTDTLWNELVLEEREHADWLRALRFELKDGALRLSPTWVEFLPQAEALRVTLQSSLQRAGAGDYTLEEALSLARELENAVLEQEFFRIVSDGPDSALQPIFAQLADATRRHRDRLHAQREALLGAR